MKNNKPLIIVILVAIVITIIPVIFLLLVPDLLVKSNSNEKAPEEGQNIKEEAKDKKDIDTEKEPSEAAEREEKNYYIVYFEVGIDENSRHFESRVANIYMISPDGSSKKLIYTDVDDEYGLAQVYSISPDGRKILCSITDDARGVYSALCSVDVETGSLVKLVEFDFSDTEEVLQAIYKEPIWSQDSSSVAYEVISNPYSSNFRDGGIHIVDIDSLKIQEVILDLEGTSLRSTTFLNPVLFVYEDTKIFAVFHPYFAKMEGDEVIDFYTVNQSLNVIDIGSGNMQEILNITRFESVEAETISSFENFSIFREPGLMVFQVLGDFEEDGDIWAYNIGSRAVTKITSNPDLREQQPDILGVKYEGKKITAVGVNRYGTIAEHTRSGSILLIDISDLEDIRVKDCEIEGTKPIFSPDGKNIAYEFFQYNNDTTYIEKSFIKNYDTGTDKDSIAIESGNIIELIGWVESR